MNNRSSTPRLSQVVRHPSLPGLGAVIRLVDSSALAVIQSTETTPEADIFPVALADAADQSLRLDLWDTRRVGMQSVLNLPQALVCMDPDFMPEDPKAFNRAYAGEVRQRTPQAFGPPRNEGAGWCSSGVAN